MAGDDGEGARARGPGAADVSETTRLLNSVNDEVHPRADVHPAAGKDSWVGAEDFDGLPRWRRPSVGLVFGCAKKRAVIPSVDGRAASRSTGCFRHGSSSSWPLAAPSSRS